MVQLPFLANRFWRPTTRVAPLSPPPSLSGTRHPRACPSGAPGVDLLAPHNQKEGGKGGLPTSLRFGMVVHVWHGCVDGGSRFRTFWMVTTAVLSSAGGVGAGATMRVVVQDDAVGSATGSGDAISPNFIGFSLESCK